MSLTIGVKRGKEMENVHIQSDPSFAPVGLEGKNKKGGQRGQPPSLKLQRGRKGTYQRVQRTVQAGYLTRKKDRQPRANHLVERYTKAGKKKRSPI